MGKISNNNMFFILFAGVLKQVIGWEYMNEVGWTMTLVLLKAL